MMSKESAMNVATGTPAPQSPGLVPAPPAAPPKDLDSARFASVAKQEAEIVKARKAIKEREMQLKPVWEKYQEYEKLKATNPPEALKLMGFSETDMFNYLANKETPKEPTAEERMAKAASDAADAKIKAWEDGRAKEAAEAKKLEEERQVKDYRGSIAEQFTADKEKFPWLNYYGPEAEALAYATQLENIELLKKEGKTPELIPVDELLELIETHYREDDELKTSLRKTKEAPAPVDKKEERSRTITTPEPLHAPKAAISKTRTMSSQATATSAGLANKTETRAEKRARLEQVLATGDRSLLRK